MSEKTSKIFIPYNLAMEIDKQFKESTEGGLELPQFYDVVEALQATGSEKNQRKAAEFFKTLSKEDLIVRAATVARLQKLLMTMKLNGRHDISSSPTT